MADDNTTTPVITTWSSVTVTLMVSLVQGVVFFVFFLHQRKKDMNNVKVSKHRIHICIPLPMFMFDTLTQRRCIICLVV